MESAERRGSATHSSDSSAGEPAAVRRRISLDGSFTGSDKRRPRVQQSPASKASWRSLMACPQARRIDADVIAGSAEEETGKMSCPQARRIAADVIAGSAEVETGKLAQSLVLDDRKSKMAICDLRGYPIDSSVGVCQNQKLPQVAAVSPQQIIHLSDDSDSCNDVPKMFATHSSVFQDGYLTARDENSLQLVISQEGHVSFEGSKSTDTELDSRVEAYQRVGDARQREKDKRQGAGCSRKCSFYRDPSNQRLRRSTLHELVQGTILRAPLALEEEKKSEGFALVAIASFLHKIMLKYNVVKSYADTFFLCRYTVTVQNSSDHSLFDTAFNLDRRLRAVEDYIRTAYVEASKQADATEPGSELKTQQMTVDDCKTGYNPIPSKVSKDTVNFNRRKISCDARDNYRLNGYVRHDALLLDLLQCAAVVRNAIVDHHRILCQLCAIGEEYVCKIEVSCRTVLNTAKSVASMVQTALEAARIAQRVLSRERQRSRSDSPVHHDVTVAAAWTHTALKDAEAAVRLHTDAALILKAARNKLESLKRNEKMARDSLHHSNVFEKDLLVYLVHLPSNIDFHELRQRKSGVTAMRDVLSAIMDVMVRYTGLIFYLSERSSSTVVNALDVLSSASYNTCSAVQSSMDALTKVARSS